MEDDTGRGASTPSSGETTSGDAGAGGEDEPGPGAPSWKVRLIARTLLGTFGLLVGVLVSEVAVRVVAPQQLILLRPDLWQPADTVGWIHRPNVDIRINTGERTVSIFTDAEGFRVGAGGRIESDHEVLLLGDSYMEALQVEHEQSVAGVLEARLAESMGVPVAVRNAAVGGWDPDQYLLRARQLLSRADYDVVVTPLYLGNDILARRRDKLPPRESAPRQQFRFPRALSFREFTDSFLRPINDFLEVRSHLYIFLRNRLQTLRMKLGLAPLTFPTQFFTAESEGPRWENTAEISEDIAALAEEHGAASLFVLIPTPFQVNEEAFDRYVEGYDLDPDGIDLEQPNRILGGDLVARGLRVYDALPAFREAHDEGQRLFGAVDPHFSPAGNELLAGLVAPQIAELLGSEGPAREAPGA